MGLWSIHSSECQDAEPLFTADWRRSAASNLPPSQACEALAACEAAHERAVSRPTMACSRVFALCLCGASRARLNSRGFCGYGALSVFGGSFQGVGLLAGDGDRAPPTDKGLFFLWRKGKRVASDTDRTDARITWTPFGQDGRANCASCSIDDATRNMLDAARIGRQTVNAPEAQVKRANTQRKNALAQHAWKSSDQPAWLTNTFYSEKVQPVIAAVSASAIARQISVSRWYAGRIREVYRPHQRHWGALAKLINISEG
jgi:hypothetical protein